MIEKNRQSDTRIAVAKTDDSVYGARESEYPKEEQ